MNNREARYFNIAKEVSLTSEFDRVKIGAILVLNKDIVAVSPNLKKSHPLQAKYNLVRWGENRFVDRCRNSTHAEMACIIKAMDYDLTKAEIYVYRYKHGKPSLARPCKACLTMIKQVGIKTIYYSTDEGFAKEELNY
jgi:deoxycytidylate deaminase